MKGKSRNPVSSKTFNTSNEMLKKALKNGFFSVGTNTRGSSISM